MSLYPVECSECGGVYESRDELEEVSRGGNQFTYHCPRCSTSVLGLTVVKGEVLDSRVF